METGHAGIDYEAPTYAKRHFFTARTAHVDSFVAFESWRVACNRTGDSRGESRRRTLCGECRAKRGYRDVGRANRRSVVGLRAGQDGQNDTESAHPEDCAHRLEAGEYLLLPVVSGRRR